MRTISRVSKAIVATGVTVGMLLAAAPAAAAPNCTVKMVGTTNTANQTHSRWTVDANGVASGMIVVSGDASCQQAVTLSAWQAPNADKGQPYDQQKLVSHVTKIFSVGTYTMSIKTPDCYYQLDMVPGSSATGINGTAQYPTGSLIGSLHGGTKVCEVTPTPTPQPTPTPTPTPTQPVELPNTGPGNTALTVAAITAVLGTAIQYYRRLRVA